VTNQALEAQYRELRERMQEFDLPESVTIRELCELALAGNSLCQDILHQAAGRLSRVLANLICLLNPGKLLLGGDHPGRSTALPHVAPVPGKPVARRVPGAPAD
jgi:predicted NBD/HSP70 family sugar kinase